MTRSIEDRLNSESAPGWRPEPGEQLVGTIVEIGTAHGDYGEYPLLVVERTDGTDVSVHAFHTVLKSELASKRPTEGDVIGIKYLGIPAGKKYESYKVVLERNTRPADTDWDAIGRQAATEQAATEQAAPVTTPATFDEEPF